MKLLPIILCLAVTGCSSWRFSLIPMPTPVQESPLNAAVEDRARPERSIDELLVSRLGKCQQSEPQRDALIAAYVNGGSEQSTGEFDERKLDAMLVALCQPASNPQLLNQLLADLTSTGAWPEDYAALFDLLIAAQQAYSRMEKAYNELKVEHENTIQGLSEIEADLELQNSALQNRKRDL